MEQEVTVDVSADTIKTKEEMALEDALHYLGGFTLPLKDDTIQIITDEDGNKQAVLDSEFALRLRALLKREEEMEAEVKKFKDYAHNILSENNITDIVSSEGVNLLLTKPYVRNGVDTSKLREMMPSVADFFNKTTNVKGSVSIKVDAEEPYNPWLK